MAKVTCKTCGERFKMHERNDCKCDNGCCPIKYDITGMELNFDGMTPGNVEIINEFNTPAPKIILTEGDAAYQKWLEHGISPDQYPF